MIRKTITAIKNAFKSSTPTKRPPYPVVDGLDVSHHQTYVNFKEFKARGFEFCFVKSTQGIGFQDPMYFKHTKAAREAGMLTGAYHFLEMDKNPILQAKNFYNYAGVMNPELGYVLDWEREDPMGTDHAKDLALEFLREIEVLTKRKPIIYGGHVIRGLNLGTEFLSYPLWVAHYTNADYPKKIQPWDEFTFWQYTENFEGRRVDANYFKGTLEELKTKFVKGNV